MSILVLGGFTGNLIIFEHPVSLYRYSPVLDLYPITDLRFSDFSLYTSLDTIMPVFNENFENALQSGKPVFTLPYNPFLAKIVKVCLDTYFSDCLKNWHTLSFFHNDEDTAKITLATGDNPLAYKIVLVEDMLRYPYIKKYEIPYKTLITLPFLTNLLDKTDH